MGFETKMIEITKLGRQGLKENSAVKSWFCSCVTLSGSPKDSHKMSTILELEEPLEIKPGTEEDSPSTAY